MKTVAVIGAGPAGLTAAHELSRAGYFVEVFEASEHLGGMARSFELWDTMVDLGPHRFFTRDPRVNKIWNELVGDDFEVVDRLTRIYYRGKLFNYPLAPLNVVKNIGVIESARSVLSYIWEKICVSKDSKDLSTFEGWVVDAFGRRLFELFFEDYSEKLWGIPCDEIDSAFAAQRIKKFSLGSAVVSAFGFGKGKHQTLTDRFNHPMEGAGLVYRRMAKQIREADGKIHLNRPIAGLQADGKGIKFGDGTTQEFDSVISTMPITSLCRSLPEIPTEVSEALSKLTFRNTILVYLNVSGRELFPDQWLYIQSPELQLGRVTNFANWPNGKASDAEGSILALEYWCNDEDELWQLSDGDLVELASREIGETEILGSSKIADAKVIRVPKCYPVYRKGYEEQLKPLIEFLNTTYPNVYAIGRYGAFKYNNQDHSILMGILAAQNIAHGAGHDLWGVNTDYGVYQETAAEG